MKRHACNEGPKVENCGTMFKGDWNENVYYAKGDIVYVPSKDEYHICAQYHTSSATKQPAQEDVYWIFIDNMFLTSSWQCATIAQPFVQPYVHPYKQPLENREVSDPESKHRLQLKRKLRSVERNIDEYKKRKTQAEHVNSLEERLLLLNVDIETKSFIMEKYENSRNLSGSDYSKANAWLNCVASIPFGKNKPMKVRCTDKPHAIKDFILSVKTRLDASIHGLDDVKQEILEFVARKITSPKSKGHVLALCGKAGVGKTKIIKSLAKALDLPFYQINCGGLNDAAILTGHSETYVGSKPGKIVEIVLNAGCMNPIIYLDELDKISQHKSAEINGVLTHLLDEEQNNKFQDNYLSNVGLNLSKAFFVMSFNDATKVDEIVSDRMKIIHIGSPSTEDKVMICQDKMIPEILAGMNFDKKHAIQINEEVIQHVILHACHDEPGVRQLKKTWEKILNRLNYDILVENFADIRVETSKGGKKNFIITSSYVERVIPRTRKDALFLSMYS